MRKQRAGGKRRDLLRSKAFSLASMKYTDHVDENLVPCVDAVAAESHERTAILSKPYFMSLVRPAVDLPPIVHTEAHHRLDVTEPPCCGC
jgi:hypothetical protein